MFDPSEFFTCKLRDLGTVDPAMAKIYAPEPDIGGQKIGITQQFLANAEIYYRDHAEFPHFKQLLASTLKFANFRPSSGMSILDIGSGFGNTAVPMSEIFVDPKIVATDLSESLLVMLRDHSRAHSLDSKISAVCMDASKDYFVHGSFDLIVGGYILHHIVDPGDAIAAAYRALKPGGIAIWFEPFEAGYAVLRSVLEGVQADCLSGKEKAPDDLLRFFGNQVRDWKTRSDPNKSLDLLHVLDDKHLFTRNYFDRTAKSIGFGEVKVLALDADVPIFRSMINGLIAFKNMKPEYVPDWIWERVDRWDTIPSKDLKADLLLQGAVVMTKR